MAATFATSKRSMKVEGGAVHEKNMQGLVNINNLVFTFNMFSQCLHGPAWKNDEGVRSAIFYSFSNNHALVDERP